MTTYRCRKGCVGSPGADGKPRPIYHPGTWACPKEGSYDAGRFARYEEARKKSRELISSAKTAPAEAPAAPAAAPSPTPAPSGGLQRLELGTRVAETARRNAEDQKKAEEDWLLPADSSQTFFETFRNMMRTVAHWLDDLLDAKHTEEGEIKDAIFEMNSHDIAAARGGFGQRLATKVVKALGAKTLEQGIATVDSLAFLMMFAMMFLQLVGHFWKVAGQSPRLKKWREKQEKAKVAREEKARLTAEQKAKAIDTTAKPAAAPG